MLQLSLTDDGVILLCGNVASHAAVAAAPGLLGLHLSLDYNEKIVSLPPDCLHMSPCCINCRSKIDLGCAACAEADISELQHTPLH